MTFPPRTKRAREIAMGWIIQNFAIIVAATVAVFGIVATCEWLGGN